MPTPHIHRLVGPDPLSTDQVTVWEASCVCEWTAQAPSRNAAGAAYERHIFDLRRQLRAKAPSAGGGQRVHRLVEVNAHSAKVYLIVDAPSSRLHGAERFFDVSRPSSNVEFTGSGWTDSFTVQHGDAPEALIAETQAAEPHLDEMAQVAIEHAIEHRHSGGSTFFVELAPLPFPA